MKKVYLPVFIPLTDSASVILMPYIVELSSKDAIQ